MSLALERETPPLQEDETGAIRVGNSRVLLETVIRAFQDGAPLSLSFSDIRLYLCPMSTTQLATISDTKML